MLLEFYSLRLPSAMNNYLLPYYSLIVAATQKRFNDHISLDILSENKKEPNLIKDWIL